MKNVRTAPLHELVDRFAESIVHLSPAAIARLLEAAERPPPAESASSVLLSPREREVYDEVVRGRRSHEIGKTLGISLKTVQTHRSRINKKLGARSTAELVRIAAREGML